MLINPTRRPDSPFFFGLAFLFAVTFSACSGGGSIDVNKPGDHPSLPPGQPAAEEELVRSTNGFRVTVLPETFTLGGSVRDVALTVEDTDSELVLQISVTAAEGLKALYCEVAYDPANLDPLSAQPTNNLGQPFNVSISGSARDSRRLLHLAVLDRPGAVHFGEVLERPQQLEGFSGDGVLAEVRFARRPFDYQTKRGVSMAPGTDASRSPFNHNSALGITEWHYANQGDYDQNSETNIADLTPLALHMGETAPAENGGHFLVTDERSVIDGDGNGEINVADITPIGQNFGSMIEGYNVYAGQESDYPAANGTTSTIAAAGQVLFADGNVQEGESRLSFTLDVPPGATETMYWVRPYAGDTRMPGYEGTPSEMDGDQVVVVAPNVKIIDGNHDDPEIDSEFRFVSVDDVNFTVLDPPDGDSIVVDDIIVGFFYTDEVASGGYMRRVTGVTELGGDELELETSGDAILGDLFLKGAPNFDSLAMDGATLTDYTGSLPAGGPADKVASSAPATRQTSATLGFNYDGTVLINERSGDDFFHVTLPRANLGFTPDINIDWDVNYLPPGLNWFLLEVTGELDSELEIVINGEWDGDYKKEVLLADWVKNFKFFIGPVPVWITVKIELFSGLEAEAAVDMYVRTGYDFDSDGKFGVKYTNSSGWDTFSELNHSFDTLGPDVRVKGSADAKVYLRPEFTAEFYSTVGASIDLKPYIKGHVDGSYDLVEGPYCVHWDIKGGIGSNVELFVDISFWDKKWDFNLFNTEFDIADGEIGCAEGPTPPVADIWSSIGGLDVTFHGEFLDVDPPAQPRGSYDPDGGSPGYPTGITIYIWDLHSDRSIDGWGTTPTIDYHYDEYYEPISITLWVIDEEQMIGKDTKSIQAVPPIP